jgi:hypothetical protein
MERKQRRQKRKNEDFREFMPGYWQQNQLFDRENPEAEDRAVRRRLVWQLVFLVVLIAIQLVLFIYLLRATVNLG